MKNLWPLSLTLFVMLFLSAGVNAHANGGGKHLVLNLVGTGLAYNSSVADIDGDGVDDDAVCFDVDLFNAKNQKLIGTATDCLSNVETLGLGLQLVGTTTFNLPRGSLTVRGNTSVQQAFDPTVTPNGEMISHITGASGTGNAVIDGTGKFKDATGTSRLSGMVNLSAFDGMVGEIFFDCLFVIDLDDDDDDDDDDD